MSSALKHKPQVLSTVEVGEVVNVAMGEHEVRPVCENKHNGYWHCVTHKRTFRNQFEKDTHIGHGKHKMLWLCLEHGPEKP